MNMHCGISLLLVGCCLCFAATASAQMADTAWPSYRGDTQNAAGSDSLGPGPEALVKWRYETDSLVRSSPAISSDGTVYFGSQDECLYAVNPNGTLSWRFDAGGQVRSSPAIADDGTIYVGTRSGELLAVDPNGTQKWRFDTGGYTYSSPNIGADGTVYVASGSGNLYAINPSGAEKWRYSAGVASESSPTLSPDGSTIYFATMDGVLRAVDTSGGLQWSVSGVNRTVAVDADGTIYGSSAGVKAIDPDGTQKWQFDIPGTILSDPGLAPDGTVHIASRVSGTSERRVWAVNPDGSEKWRHDTQGFVCWSGPVTDAAGNVYFGEESDDYNIYALDSNGQEKWRVPTGDSVMSSAAVSDDGTLYIGSNDGGMYALVGAPAGRNVLDFDALPAGSDVGDAYRDLGAVFAPGAEVTAYAGYPHTHEASLPNCLDVWEAGHRIDFVVPGQHVAGVTDFVSAWVHDTNVNTLMGVLEAYNSLDQLIASDTMMTNTGQMGNLIVSAPDIAYVLIYTDGDGAIIDDITFTTPIPEPATVGMLAVGGVALLRRRRRGHHFSRGG